MIFTETERLVLRSWKQEDLPLFIAINRDERVMRYFPSILNESESEDFIIGYRMSSIKMAGVFMQWK